MMSPTPLPTWNHRHGAEEPRSPEMPSLEISGSVKKQNHSPSQLQCSVNSQICILTNFLPGDGRRLLRIPRAKQYVTTIYISDRHTNNTF